MAAADSGTERCQNQGVVSVVVSCGKDILELIEVDSVLGGFGQDIA